jgi:hypothetical protein
VNYPLRHKFSDLLKTESDTWVLGNEDFQVKSEQACISSPAPTIGNSLRKHALEIHACSFCDKMFGRKGDWKRHEGSLHVPQKQWYCLESGCNRTFTAGNKFRWHHQNDHRCENCTHDTDEAVMSVTQTTSAWGCGFCAALLMTWDDRASHIGNHYDTGSKRSDWDFSREIHGLLRQPKVVDAWESLLDRIHGPSSDNWPRFEWSKESSQLLKSLQCANPGQCAMDIAQSAYNLGLPAKYGDEMDTLSPYTGSYSFLEQATTQEFQINPLERGNSVSTLSSTPIGGNEAFQPGKPWVTPTMVAVNKTEVLGDSDVVDRYFQNSKDYIRPCAENLEPTAWLFWPHPDPPLD